MVSGQCSALNVSWQLDPALPLTVATFPALPFTAIQELGYFSRLLDLLCSGQSKSCHHFLLSFSLSSGAALGDSGGKVSLKNHLKQMPPRDMRATHGTLDKQNFIV